MPDTLTLDYESFSKADIKSGGLSRYARDPSTEVLMCAYAINNDPVDLWVPAEGERMPRDLRDALDDPDAIKRSWNAPFEVEMTDTVLDIETDIREWRCTMTLAYSLALPGSLAKAGEVIGLPADKAKDARGKALIRKFCIPRKPTKKKPWVRATHETDPEDWEVFKQYCVTDVEAERAIFNRIKRWDMPPHEWELWFLDQEINYAGIPINLDRVQNAIRIRDAVVEKRLTELKRLTGLENPNSTSQLLPWLQAHGYAFDDLKAGHVRRAVEREEERCDEEDIKLENSLLWQVLSRRQEVSKTSVKKYDALLAATDDDGYLRYTLQFAGAGRTWRWAGRRVQFQNLARPAKELEKIQHICARHVELFDPEVVEFVYDKPMDLLSTTIRPCAEAIEGYIFADADLNAIENRVLGWMCEEEKILDVFRNGRDPYLDFAKYMFRQPYEELLAEYKAGDKSKRTIAKPPVLGCGYRLSAGYEYENEKTGEIEATGLLGYALNMGVKLTPEQAEHAVKTFREEYEAVVEYWHEIEWAAKRCIRREEQVWAKYIYFDRSGPFMRMGLPSGRFLHYCRPRLEMVKTPWGQVRETITYEQMNDKNQWVRTPTQGGKLVENGDQAIARDLLANAMTLARRMGYLPRIHVHDQAVLMVKAEKGEKALADLLACMRAPVDWAPGLPLDAAGAVNKLFLKD